MSDESDELTDKQIAMVRAHVAQLGEFFETVQILVSRPERDADGNNVTISIELGGGNIYARQGHVREWLLKQDEMARQMVRDHADD